MIISFGCGGDTCFMRCLVIEPNMLLARLVGNALQYHGYSALLASDMSQAETHFAEKGLAFLLVHAGSDGAMIKAARQTWPHTPIIATSVPAPTVLRGGATTDIGKEAGAAASLRLGYTHAELEKAITLAKSPSLRAETPAHVLVVDDSRTILAIAKTTLSENRFRVSVSSSMEDAMDSIELLDVDAVVTDIFMPGMGGIEGISLIRKRFAKVAIIAMSGGLSEKMAADKALSAALQIGADATLSKPFQGQHLAMAVRQALNSRAKAVAASEAPTAVGGLRG